MIKYLTLALLATAMPANASDTKGFTATDLAAAAKVGQPDAALADAREFTAQTETLRAAFVLKPQAGWAILSIDEAKALRFAFGPPRPAGGDAVQWFMRGASARAGAGNMTGLYNPLADVWLVLRWQRIGGSPCIVDAIFLPGSALRDANDRTPWTESTAPYADALAHTTASARLTFASLDADAFFPAAGPMKQQAGDEAFAAIALWMGSLRPWGEDKARLAQWKALHKNLAEGKAGSSLASLPPQIRASLLPVGAITSGSNTSLLLMSPLAPQLVVAADYGARNKPDLSLINLANARPGARP